MGVDLCTYRAQIGCFRNLRFYSQCCSPEAPCLLVWMTSCLLVWMVISQLMLKLAGDVEENPGPRQHMATLSSLKNKMKPKEWDMMGKRTLLTLDLTCEIKYDIEHALEGIPINRLAQLPEEVFELKELEALDLTNNKDIDLSNQLTKLPNLKVLSLHNCNLKTVPAAVMKLPQLEMLILSNNENITLPDGMSGLTNLTVLDLDKCDLDTLPPVVLKLSNLQVLDITANWESKLKISLPDELSNMNKLKGLRLRCRKLDTVPPVVLKLPQLEKLDLSYNIGIHLPDGLAGLTNLRVLGLAATGMETVPPAVLKLPQLEELDLSGNILIHLPDGLAGLTNLRVLKLAETVVDTVPQVVWRLTQLEWLDLSWNRELQTLPAEIGQLANLKHLDLSWCKLRTLPPEVGRLTQLEWLNLYCPQLQTLPAEIGQLANLKYLDLSQCELRTLPPEVGRLTQLEWLDLSHNPLQTLPAKIGQLTNVKHLDLSGCALHKLPPEVWRLTQLEWLGLSHNNLQTLPAKVGLLNDLCRIEVSDNPLTKPPAEVCSQGIAAIRQYFDELERSEEVVSAHLKVVVLGETMAGKTSLVQTLESGESTLTEEEDRTHCVEITQWAPDDNITFEVYDFGGHDVYHLTHQFFLTPDAFHLLLVNLQEYSCNEESYKKHVGFWLDTLNAHVPGAVVTIVGSKMDMCSEAEINGKVKDIEEKFQQQIDTWKSNTQRQIKKLEERSKEDKSKEEQREIKQQLELTKSLPKCQLRFTDKNVHCISSAKPSGLDTLRNHILESANNTKLFPKLRKILPRTWVDFEQQMHELRDKGTEKPEITSGDGDDLSGDGDDSSFDNKDLSTLNPQSDKKSTWLTQADCLQLGQLAGLTSDRLEPVLSYLQQVGTILRYTDIPELKDLVFHDPPALIEIFKDLFHHDVEKLFKTPRLKNADFTGTQLEDFAINLRDCGLIQKKVMTCLLSPNIDPDVVTALMLHFGLCFELKDKTDCSKHSCKYQIPWYLEKQIPEQLKDEWPDEVSEDQEQLQLMCNITGFCPRGLFQRFSVRIHQHVEDRVDWKDGVMAYRQDYPVLVCSKPVSDDTYITMATRGGLDQAGEMWGVVHPLLDVLFQLLQEWPGVLYSLHVTCAHCIKAGLDRPYQHALRDRTAEDGRDVRCPRVKYTASTSADLVYRPARFSVSSPQLKRPQYHNMTGNPPEKKGGKDESAGTSRESSHQVKRSQDHDMPGNPPKKLKDGKDESAVTFQGIRVILLINDEYGTSKGGISTINCQASQTLQGKAVVYCTVLQLKVPKQDQEAANRDGVILIQPDPRGKTEPTLDWLTDYHSVHFPNLPKDVTCIIGHADITDTAARNIKDQLYPKADLIMFTHVLPEDTEYFKGGQRAIKASEKEDAMVDQVDNAKAAFSVGERIFNHFENKYRGSKKPKEHHMFFPRPSKIFAEATIQPGSGSGKGEKVVLCIGRVKNAENLKGYNLAARAIGIARKYLKSLRWITRGISKDDWEKSLKILEANLDSGDLKLTLRPYGTQEEIRDDMMTAHLVLMPSRSEPFGLVGLEAIAAGIPVLISDKSGLADMIEKFVADDKLPAGLKNRIVETSMRDCDMDKTAETWALKIRETLTDTDTAFYQANKFKDALLKSKYWEDSEKVFLRACGITDCAAQQQSS
ncbi:PREDICTED: malignant fibrous histiocytoma-amplified sequence 1-like isoform X2 [Branchiostoma belcheri]|uniref:Malignant fibrous histiocytoma-amplified sequence 1-like isoform X2 n=1 Tax=Branchiostoma belcheri TaxID=7741 RepID=A0A6P5ADR3_BRABE|nr:PREDICTED: malignant fibrous histiocytoma-amplified sequence 1-like isoform X2 [Branchiostoma belcheri]